MSLFHLKWSTNMTLAVNVTISGGLRFTYSSQISATIVAKTFGPL